MTFEIRLATTDDAAGILDIYRPVIKETTTTFEIEVPSLQIIQNRVTATMRDYPWLILTHQHQIAGYAYAGPHRGRPAYKWSTELSVYVHPDYFGQRAGTVLYRSLIEILKTQGYRNLLAGITLPNLPSVKFHESLGFQPVGTYHKVGYKFGQWHAVSWWEMALPGVDPPATPLPLSEIQNYPEWPRLLQSGLKFQNPNL